MESIGIQNYACQWRKENDNVLFYLNSTHLLIDCVCYFGFLVGLFVCLFACFFACLFVCMFVCFLGFGGGLSIFWAFGKS